MAEPYNPQEGYMPNAFVPGTSITYSVAEARHIDPSNLTGYEYPEGFQQRWLEAYRNNPNEERIQRSSRVKPRRWRHFCSSPEINHLLDLAPTDGVFREGIKCPYPGWGYVTHSGTPLVNCIGDLIETMDGINLIDDVGPFNRF
jgi:hypothetical protein